MVLRDCNKTKRRTIQTLLPFSSGGPVGREKRLLIRYTFRAFSSVFFFVPFFYPFLLGRARADVR